MDVPQGALIELLEEVGAQEKREDAVVDSAEDAALLFVRESALTCAMTREEIGGLVA